MEKSYRVFSCGAIKALNKELSMYEVSKGMMRFSLEQSFPFDLVSKIVKFRVKENEERAAAKKINKPSIKKIISKK